jgi:hypothetical protein
VRFSWVRFELHGPVRPFVRACVRHRGWTSLVALVETSPGPRSLHKFKPAERMRGGPRLLSFSLFSTVLPPSRLILIPDRHGSPSLTSIQGLAVREGHSRLPGSLAKRQKNTWAGRGFRHTSMPKQGRATFGGGTGVWWTQRRRRSSTSTAATRLSWGSADSRAAEEPSPGHNDSVPPPPLLLLATQSSSQSSAASSTQWEDVDTLPPCRDDAVSAEEDTASGDALHSPTWCQRRTTQRRPIFGGAARRSLRQKGASSPKRSSAKEEHTQATSPLRTTQSRKCPSTSRARTSLYSPRTLKEITQIRTHFRAIDQAPLAVESVLPVTRASRRASRPRSLV